VALATVATLVPTGCADSEGGRDVDGRDAETTLLRQRSDVRDAARALLRGAEEALPGTTATSTGSWRGCESDGPDEYRTFRYLARARVDVAGRSGAGSTYLDPLRPVLEEAGFRVGEAGAGPGDRRSLDARRGDLVAVFSLTGAGAFVTLSVSGPCVDVPEEDREEWQRRREPDPSVR
jgi:hypothetical protein